MNQDDTVSKSTHSLARPLARIKIWGERYGEHLLLLAMGIAVLKYLGKELAWPAILLLVLVSLRDGLNKLFSRANSITIKVWGNVITLDADKVEDLIKSVIEDLSPDQKELFLYICQNSNVRDQPLGTGPLQFKPNKQRPRTILHWDLRELRAFNLIRVRERGSLRPNVHILLTSFGKVVEEIVPLGKFDPQHIENYLRDRAQKDADWDRPEFD